MQHDLQQQVPFGVGLLCSSWFPTWKPRSKKSQHACHLNVGITGPMVSPTRSRPSGTLHPLCSVTLRPGLMGKCSRSR